MFTVRIKKAPHIISGLFDVTTLNMCHMLRSTLRIFARVRSWSAYPFPTADIRYIFFLTMSSVPEPRWGPRPQIPSSIADNFCRLRPWTVYQLCQSIFIIVYTNGARRTNAASTCYDEFHIADGLPLSCCCRHGLSRYWFRTAAGPEPGWLYYGSRSAASWRIPPPQHPLRILSFWSSDIPLFEALLKASDQQLFGKVIHNKHHLLYKCLPPPPVSSPTELPPSTSNTQ